ncbi:hypothetical protein CI238_10856 [Colletotrichum incanum]|uniref:Uncharacterized protein n=1 Tax=Colletotrichum incanum TaxID=1573173 RepID=A0A161YDS5_COLIC|nr:hypothetical protein CI238_10856 [Colletotrichum incanum]
MASNDMYSLVGSTYKPSSSIPPSMNIGLPRLQELDRPLSPAVTVSAFDGQSMRSQMGDIDKFLIGLLNRRSMSQRLKSKSTRLTSARRPRKSPTGPRCNVKYTIQQIDFIDYFRVDHQLSWKDVEVKYAAVFPEDAAKGYRRGPQGLQGVYYRKNKQIPATDENNLLLFDDENNLKTLVSIVREQNKMHKPIGLLQMHPERAINYPWVTDEHKSRARQAQLDAAQERKRKTGANNLSGL